MYELSRVALQSVGPAGARYQDVLLDFSAVGRPVSDRRMSLFGAGAPARRPSPATVLFLENGGGKSVLIKLIFSVVLPGRRQIVGTSGGGVLERFVLPKDTSHVVLEWTHARSGRRLITGKVMEWKDRRESSDPRNLLERWYHFRPTATLHLDNLPFSSSNHYRTQTDYLNELAKADTADSAMEYGEFVRQGEWTERLADLNLDPELFKYQRSMNADEGEAAEAFSFTSDIAFVNFLLGAVLPTDPAKELADLLDTYAGRLHRRSVLLIEQEFAQGALSILQSLADARVTADEARVRRRITTREMATLMGRIRARAGAEAGAVRRIQGEARQLADDSARARAEHARMEAATIELERLVAELRWQDARSEANAAQEEARRAEDESAAWAVAPTVLRRLTAEQRLSSLRVVVAAAEKAAQPALAARDEAAALLIRALRDGMEELKEKSSRIEVQAVAAAEQAEADQKVHNDALGRAIGQVKEAHTAEQRVREVRGRIADAVREGLLAPEATASSALEEAQEAVAGNARRLATLEKEVKRLESEQQEAARAVETSERQLAGLHRGLDSAEQKWKAAMARRDALGVDPAFLDLLGHRPDHLETAAEALRSRLVEVRDKAAAEITDLHVAEAQDARSRFALESTELLPASSEATRVKELLVEGGITAWTGWEYLAAIPDVERRRKLVRQVPQLASGVLLNNPAQLPAAEELVNRQEPHPSVFLAVGTTEAVTRTHPDISGVGFIVEPHPALYDERSADTERRLVRQRHDQRVARLAELSERRAAAAALVARIQEWRRDFPPGRLAELQQCVEERRLLAEAGEQEARELRAFHETLSDRRLAALEEAEPVRSAQRGLDERAHRLTVLADEEARVPGWEATADLRREAGEREREAAGEADRAARRGREQAAALLRQVDGMRASASRLSEELTGLPSDVKVPGVPEGASAPLEVLRRDYVQAAETYLRVSVGDQLLADLQQTEREISLIAAELDEHQDAVVELAGKLLNGPQGTDSASRELARRIADQAAPELRLRASELSAHAASRRKEYEKFTPPLAEVDLAPFERPRHVGHGLRLLEEAKEMRNQVARTVTELDRHGQRLKESLEEAESSRKGFELLLMGSDEFAEFAPITGPAGPEPYGGDLAAAAAEHQAARTVHDEARKQETVAEDEERRFSDQLVRHAGRDRFLPLETSSRRIILEIERAELPGRAAEWVGAMRGRLRSLTDDLETIDRHRTAIVRQLSQQVAEALETLRRAERFSRLPQGLGDWSGQNFLRIRFKSVSEEALRDHMGLLVDDMAKSTIEALETGREPKRDGLSLILKGVAAGAPSGFKVTILKPDSALLAQKVPVSDIRAVFSGGQLLTTAIILYCTMAALRANDRGRVGHQHSGVLFLDNPIGRASTTYLLRLQQSVARTLGVQLIYTTGLFDTNALDTFPLVIRLRNDTDLGARRKYLSVDGVFGRYLDESLAAGAPQISASRYFVKDETADDDE
ncbi:hypothetical protein JI76_33265 [Streptomyces anulatus]|uniref:hypothetical protein n=1 Tax=Streptomyces anulatus TaxID=1892 RepID=UPI0006DB755C|nr:hypothetical protein [Streptomyces anulatus]KPL29922.1 hypothetical protein JI76_33265 [Streptomyces anulatus]